jgi:hypothetical protein
MDAALAELARLLEQAGTAGLTHPVVQITPEAAVILQAEMLADQLACARRIADVAVPYPSIRSVGLLVPTPGHPLGVMRWDFAVSRFD